MKSLRIGCICNPDAARNRRLLASIRPALIHISNALYAETKGSRDFSDILRTDVVESLDFLILSGGDGTLQQGLSALLASGADRFPTLALLPAGSTNVASTDIAGRVGLSEAVNAIISGLPTLTTRSKRPLLISTGETGNPLAGFFFGIGAAPAAVSRYRKVRRPVRGMPFLDAGASVVAIGGTVLEIGLKAGDWGASGFWRAARGRRFNANRNIILGACHLPGWPVHGSFTLVGAGGSSAQISATWLGCPLFDSKSAGDIAWSATRRSKSIATLCRRRCQQYQNSPHFSIHHRWRALS